MLKNIYEIERKNEKLILYALGYKLHWVYGYISKIELLSKLLNEAIIYLYIGISGNVKLYVLMHLAYIVYIWYACLNAETFCS